VNAASLANTAGDVRLASRTAKGLTGTYPEVRAAVAAQRARDLLLDGEVVAFDGEQTSLSRLQQRLGITNPTPERVAANPVVYCVFELLEVDCEDLTGWEGLIAKRAHAPYTAGRSKYWLKLKCVWE
jgi:ATP-dependent DNA ligase